MSKQLKGVLIAVFGVVVLSPDTLLIRLAGVEPWALLVYRGILMAVGTLLFSKLIDSTPIAEQFTRIGRTGIWSGIFFTISTIAFVNATLYTTIAQTLIIVATSPLFAAFFARSLLGEHLKFHTLIAIVCVLLGMFLVVGQTTASAHIIGNICAAISAISIALTFVLNRKNKQINMVPAMSLSGVLTALVALPFASWVPLNINSLVVIVSMGLVVSLAFALMALAAQYISAAEVSLVLPLETVGGIALAWWLLNEEPSGQTLLGAAVILLTLTIHARYAARAGER